MFWRPVAVSVPPLLLAVAGLTHPSTLTAATSQHWFWLHLILIPVFPLLAVCWWLLLRGERGAVAGVARVAAFGYACFYSALDTVNGVAVGVLVWRSPPDQVAATMARLRPVLDVGNMLAFVGSGAFLLTAVLTGALFVRRFAGRAVPGAAVVVLSAISFLDSHIYWPRGVVTMVGLAVGLVLLARLLDPVVDGRVRSGRDAQTR